MTMNRIGSHITVLLLVFYILIPNALIAQEDWEGDGEIEDSQVIIEKDKKIILPNASRSYDKVKQYPKPDTPAKLEYSFSPIQIPVSPVPLRIRPLTIQESALPGLFGGYARGGFGNYGTFYGEAFINNKRNAEFSNGIYIRHLSSSTGPIDDSNSGNSENILRAHGNLYSGKVTLGGDASYQRNAYRFYGYNSAVVPEEDTIKQEFDRIAIRAHLYNDFNSYVPFRLDGSFSTISDGFEAQESDLSFALEASYQVNDEINFGINGSASFISQEDMTFTNNRILISARPTIGFRVEDFNIRAGLNIVYHDDTLGGISKLQIYPVADASYDFGAGATVYAGIRGDMIKNTLNSITGGNPWLEAQSLVFHNNMNFEFFGGLKGNLSQPFSYHLSVSAATFKNFHYFLNGNDPSRFALIYDTGNTQRLKLTGEAAYSISNQVRVNLKGSLFEYNTGLQARPWHMPNYELSLGTFINLYDKIYLGADVFIMGGITALDNNGNETDLDTIVDINFRADYKLSKEFGIFLKFNNILSSEYERYLNYPVRGFQVLGGVSYSF